MCIKTRKKDILTLWKNDIYKLVKDSDLSYDGLKKIKFIDACIKETQRYYAFIMLLREADHDCEVAGVKVCQFLSVSISQ